MSLSRTLKTLQRQVAQAENLPISAAESLEKLAKYAEQASTFQLTTETKASLSYLFSQMVFHLFNAIDGYEQNFESLVKLAIEGLQDAAVSAETSQNRIILVYANHAELLVDGEVRGTIPVYDRCDQDELREIAKLFKCQLKFAESEQLVIFGTESEKTETLNNEATQPADLQALAYDVADAHIAHQINQLSLLTILDTQKAS